MIQLLVLALLVVSVVGPVLGFIAVRSNEENRRASPAYKLFPRLSQGKGREQVLLWVALIVVVVVLLVLTLRLARTAPRA